MLLRMLPDDSLYKTTLRDTIEVDELPADADPVFGPWNLTNYQLAALIDRMNVLIADLAKAPRPDPTPRPKLKIRKGAFDAAAVAYLQAIRDRHRAAGGD